MSVGNLSTQPAESKTERCSRCNQLQEKLRLVEEERDQYLDAVYKLTRKDFDLDKESLLAQMGKGQSLHELIDELRVQGNNHDGE